MPDTKISCDGALASLNATVPCDAVAGDVAFGGGFASRDGPEDDDRSPYSSELSVMKFATKARRSPRAIGVAAPCPVSLG